MDLIRSDCFDGDSASLAIIPIPRPHSPFGPPLGLTTDIYAWNIAIDRPYCLWSVEFPDSEICWVSASTRGSFELLRFTTHGFLTYICPLSGQRWVVFCLPDDCRPGVPPITLKQVAVVVQPGQVL